MRVIGAIALLLLLAGCSSAPTIDTDGWAPAQSDVTTVECGDLQDEWGIGEEESPDACWTFEESTGLDDHFVAMVDDFSDHAGAEPASAPECVSSSEFDVGAVGCQAQWGDDGGAVVLSARLMLDGSIAEMEAGTEADASTPRLYAITLWTSEEPLGSDPGFGDLDAPLTD
ncbi:hypothetical protein [Demequina muriae]|uniref:Uncharacterized protein n=1 Tax=Demequina muriae TaxID=3051664 RepID=A0ABT8GI32_9MICO|nr:hypothetical protein [Demequina sp. EGI L300058]MDN4480919.1 hypothetical protein [Demequina sp. EGI L300058]